MWRQGATIVLLVEVQVLAPGAQLSLPEEQLLQLLAAGCIRTGDRER